MPDLIEQAKEAFHRDDAGELASLLERHPALKERINEPLGPFDSPLIMGARSRPMLDVLLNAGADINARSRWWAGGFGLLDCAAPELANYAISRGAVVDAHSAARLGMVEKLKTLVAADPGLVHARGGDGQTPLHFASTVEIAEYLLNQGAAIDALDIDHESTPAQYMVRERQEVARYLVKRGCRTDVLMASALGDLKLVSAHLDSDPACIHMSVTEDSFPKRNPRAGGTIYIWTLGQNKTAHLVAREFKHEEVFRLLLERSPEALKLALACELGDEETFRKLMASCPDLVRNLSESDQRKVARAAENNNTQAVGLMLEAGWPVNVTSRHGASALHWAGFHGNLEMAKQILAHHPPLELRDRDFQATPLGWAVYGSENGWHRQTGDYAGVVKALLNAGAKPLEEIGGTPAVRAVLQAGS